MLAWSAFAQEFTPARNGFYSEGDAAGFQFNRRLSAELGTRKMVDKEGKIEQASAAAGASYAISRKADVRIETQRATDRPSNISVGTGLNF